MKLIDNNIKSNGSYLLDTTPADCEVYCEKKTVLLSDETESYHSEDLQEIISAPPSWLVRWGMSLFLSVLISVVGLTAFIHYPDVVKTRLIINTSNSPKLLVTRVAGKLVKLFVKENEVVNDEQPLAFLESTANHEDVLQLLKFAYDIRHKIYMGKSFSMQPLTPSLALQIGELQGSYQSFYQSCLAYKASVAQGFLLQKKGFLEKDMKDIQTQRKYIVAQKTLQERDYELARQEYEIHQKLTEQKVEAPMELKKQEAGLLSKQFPLQQTEASLLNNSSSYSGKKKELAELNNQIGEEKAKFIQALNSLISEIEMWKSKYVVSASQSGRVTFIGILQENQFVNANTELFYINPESTDFFGEMLIQQYNMGKVKVGQEVLIKLKSFPYQEYGIVHGEIRYVTQMPLKDSVFYAKVTMNDSSLSKLKKKVYLRNGMLADAEIITENATLLSRLFRNISRILD